MEQYAGIDVSLDSASVCFVDAQGKILKEEGGLRAGGADRLGGRAWDTHGAHWPGGRAVVAVALCRDDGSRLAG